VKVVVGTNVVVSGLLSPSGPPGRVLDLLLSGRATALYDDRILQEYREVVARPRLRLDPALAGLVLATLELDGQLVPSPPLPIQLPYPDDLPFIEVAVTGNASALITGNVRHFEPASHLVPILTPAAFVDLWREGR
jgi:putative PIN family toxin of toxin-antitoxin system